MSGERLPTIGDEIEITIDTHIVPDQWKVRASGTLEGWECVLRTRQDTDFESRQTLLVWVFAVNHASKRIYVSNSDFGRLPISDRMRPRYLRALGVVLDLVHEE